MAWGSQVFAAVLPSDVMPLIVCAESAQCTVDRCRTQQIQFKFNSILNFSTLIDRGEIKVQQKKEEKKNVSTCEENYRGITSHGEGIDD